MLIFFLFKYSSGAVPHTTPYFVCEYPCRISSNITCFLDFISLSNQWKHMKHFSSTLNDITKKVNIPKLGLLSPPK